MAVARIASAYGLALADAATIGAENRKSTAAISPARRPAISRPAAQTTTVVASPNSSDGSLSANSDSPKLWTDSQVST